MNDVTSLIERSHGGDKCAREILVEKNMGLVHMIVRRFTGRGYPAEDIVQIGSIGLLKAIEKFDTSFGVKFSTYAVPMIIGEIKRFLRDDGMIKMSRQIRENAWKIKRIQGELAQILGREATVAEVAAATGFESADIVMALEATQEVDSIYKSFSYGDGDEATLADRLADKKNDNDNIINKILINQLMNTLSDKEKSLITLRYYEDKTQSETAEILDMSQVQVSRLEKKILKRFRGLLG